MIVGMNIVLFKIALNTDKINTKEVEFKCFHNKFRESKKKFLEWF